MIDPKTLLSDLQKLLRELEADLKDRVSEVPEVRSQLETEYRAAKEGARTAQSFVEWRDEKLTQVAAAWILGSCFVRFLEDNGLVAEARLSGPGERRQQALDAKELYFHDAARRTHSDREYLLSVFEATERLPAAREVFDREHNPLWSLGVSGDGATRLLQFWQKVHTDTGTLVHDFTDPEWSTRFLGDLYQDLSESARKRYALLQTPEFVEEFILDRTLSPAIAEFGLGEVRLIDPTCGSGHFLLGAFDRLFELWTRREPGTNPRTLAQRALDQVYGVDLNPFAVAIARFRLMVAALRACEIERLADAPAFHLNLAVGDSLIHGPRPGDQGARNRYLQPEMDPLGYLYATEDAEALARILGQRYHAVVGNPPYIVVRDKALNEEYRMRFGSCSGKYSLAVPFMERFFDLAIEREAGSADAAGFVGTITSNSFMKREFGKKLIEQFIPKWDLTHVLDTSGAYIPGHGTPTVILLGRHRRPVDDVVRAVMGIRGEPSTPDDPARGRVWSAIVEQVDQVGSESDFVSVTDVPRERFHSHPWSIGGGGAAELRERLEGVGLQPLADLIESIGFMSITGEDEAFVAPGRVWRAISAPSRGFGTGEAVRDWSVVTTDEVAFMYVASSSASEVRPIEDLGHLGRRLWPLRATLRNRLMFGKRQEESGLAWYEYRFVAKERLRAPLSIAFAFVATHNHFVLDRGGKVFKQSAPVIKLPPEATEEDHLGLLGLLNSSTACFWMKQVFYPKATATGDISLEKGKPEANRYEIAGTQLEEFPIPRDWAGEASLLARIARLIDEASRRRQELEPSSVVESMGESLRSLRGALGSAEERSELLLRRMVLLQEELDWECYRLFGLADEGADPVLVNTADIGIVPEDRPGFWHHEDPSHCVPILERRFKARRLAISGSAELAQIETPVFKRLWLGQQGVFGHATSTYEDRVRAALRSWLIDRLEQPSLWSSRDITTTARLADRLRADADFLQVAELYTGRADFELSRLVADLVAEESVPLLPVLRFKDSGNEKHAAWKATWELQRQEDAIDARAELPPDDPQHLSPAAAKALKAKEVGEIPVPPKYASKDFQKPSYWRLRGKLDVPKERFVSFPGCEREGDPSLPIAWAGWNHLEMAQAIAATTLAMKEQEGWTGERLTPLLAALWELVPGVRQWHNEPDPEHHVRMGDWFAELVAEEARSLGLTMEAIEGWQADREKGRRRRP